MVIPNVAQNKGGFLGTNRLGSLFAPPGLTTVRVRIELPDSQSQMTPGSPTVADKPMR